MVRLHARIAVGLEALYGDDAEYHAAELNLHLAPGLPAKSAKVITPHVTLFVMYWL